ncbi:MAG TPA: serine/threonine-protein kinase [Polyangia bacterium]|nr:serine/threonine-protein kinase [Polyangia bacterium]
MDPLLGKVLMGHIELTAVAGRGAMGTVYRAVQTNMGRPVAVKVLRADLLDAPGAVARFLREARAAARLSHPNIVTVHLVGETDQGVPYIVMEFVDGESLDTLCQREGKLVPKRALKLARQIASALGEAHSQGIIHRDLKPENILVLDRRRETDFVKVLDFGIAKILRDENQSALSRDGSIFGTPHYIAPEQASGAEIDARADLYSLGVILFRMVTGRLPFEGASGMEVLMRHVREKPPSPRTFVPGLSRAIEALILRALEKERGERWQDAEAFLAALDAITDEVEDDPGRTIHGVAPFGLTRSAPSPGPAPAAAVPAQAPPPVVRTPAPAAALSAPAPAVLSAPVPVAAPAPSPIAVPAATAAAPAAAPAPAPVVPMPAAAPAPAPAAVVPAPAVVPVPAPAAVVPASQTGPTATTTATAATHLPRVIVEDAAMARQSTSTGSVEPVPRPEPAKAVAPTPAPEPPRPAEPAPAPGGRSGEPDPFDEFIANGKDGDRTPVRLPSSSGVDDLDEEFLPPQRRSRTVLWVALGAVAMGAVVGVLYAARAGGPRRASVQAGNATGQAPSTPAAVPQPTLYQEKTLTTGGYTLRAGLGAAPAQDEPNVLRVILRDAQGPVAGARIQAALRDGGGQETPLAVREWAGAYLANMDFRIAGRHQIKLLVEPRQGGRLETVLDLDVAAPAPAAQAQKTAPPPRTAEPSHTHKRPGDKNDKPAVDVNSLPVTVIPPDPVKAPPRQPGPSTGTRPSAGPPAAAPAPVPAASGPTRAPTPAAAPSPAASAPAASPPPAATPPSERAPQPSQPAGEEQDPYRILNNQ